MVQMWQYIGIILAGLMVLIGAFLLLKKPKAHIQLENAESIENADDSTADAPNRDTADDHAALTAPDDAFGQPPVIPRHQRTFAPPNAETVEPTVEESMPETITAQVQEAASAERQTLSPSDNNTISPLQTGNVTPSENVSSNDNGLADDLNDVLQQLDHSHRTTSATEDMVYQIKLEPTPGEPEPPKQLPTVAVEQLEMPPATANILDSHLSEQDRKDEESTLATAQQIFALYLYPNPNRVLSGERALKMLTRYGLRFGEMSCFHRHEDPEEASPLMFSVLRLDDNNAPTGFDLENLNQEEIKGLAFFLALPNHYAATGFDMMASLSGLMARDVEGMVFDENGLELTAQLKEHWRQQVIELNSQLRH